MSHEGHDTRSLDVLRGFSVALLGFESARRYLLAPAAYPDDALTYALLVRAPALAAVLLLVFVLGLRIFWRRQSAAAGTLSRSLLLQGLALIVLELTLVRAVAWFTLDYARAIGVLEVFWIVGASTIMLAVLVHLTVRDVAVFAVVAVGVYLIIGGVDPPGRYGPGTAPGLAGQLWILVLGPPEIFRPVGTSGPVIGLIHPMLPFAGVAAAGYACGALRRSAITSAAAWGGAVCDGANREPLWHTVLATLGRVPMFGYAVQLFAIHLLAVAMTSAAGRDAGYLFISQPFDGRPSAGGGFGVVVVIGCWVAGTAIAYAVCRMSRWTGQRRVTDRVRSAPV